MTKLQPEKAVIPTVSRLIVAVYAPPSGAGLVSSCVPRSMLPRFIAIASGEEPYSKSLFLERGRGKPAPSVTGADAMIRTMLDIGCHDSTPLSLRIPHPATGQFTHRASQTQAPVTLATEPERRAGVSLTLVSIARI